jgi:general secretion pathway protein C
MQKASPRTTDSTWIHRTVTLGLMALAVGGGVFWAMQIMGISHFVPDMRFTGASTEPAALPDHDLARALGGGATASTTQAPASLVLVAVVNRNGAGAALIAIDGQKAQAYRPGDQVQAGRYLIRLGLRSAELGSNPNGAATEVLSIKVPELPVDDR